MSTRRRAFLSTVLPAALLSTFLAAGGAPPPEDVRPPEGFTALFNAKDLAGWHGMGHFDPRKLWAMSAEERAAKRAADLEDVKKHWRVEDGELVNDGHGVYLTTDKDYGDIELLIDYKTVAKADSGIYLRGNPQVQIWDTTKEGGKWEIGADRGSGGLWNNSAGAPGKDPLVLADRPFGEWNSFRIIQIGDRVTIYLNGRLVVDNAVMENYWDRAAGLWPKGPIQLQTHGGEIRWRNVFVREIPPDEAQARAGKFADGFASIIDGNDLADWRGAVEGYEVKDGALQCRKGAGGTIYHKDELADFIVRLELKLPPGGNNGLAIRYPDDPKGKTDTAYHGMCELQVLDDLHESYKDIDPRQAHGSAYGMVAARRGFLRPAGQWNYQEVTVKGSTLKVELNGAVILDADLGTVSEFMGGTPHPGKDRKSGFFGFAGHGSSVAFRNVRVRRLEEGAPAAE
jgi:hypothetical protein